MLIPWFTMVYWISFMIVDLAASMPKVFSTYQVHRKACLKNKHILKSPGADSPQPIESVLSSFSWHNLCDCFPSFFLFFYSWHFKMCSLLHALWANRFIKEIHLFILNAQCIRKLSAPFEWWRYQKLPAYKDSWILSVAAATTSSSLTVLLSHSLCVMDQALCC